MNENEFNHIIDFAIEREIEAANFYKEMQLKVRFESSVSLFKSLEEMEIKHAEILQKFTIDSAENHNINKITNLKISDYLEDVVPHDNMSFQEILIIAMKREETANKLYLKLAEENVVIEKVRNLFLNLAEEEAKHKLQLESIYDKEVLKDN